MKKLLSIAVLFLLLAVNVSALNIISVNTVPTTVEPGNRATINMKVENNYDVEITNIIVQLDFSSPDLPLSPSGSSTETLDELNDDDYERIDFDVIVDPDATPGIYKIPVLMSYDIEEDNQIVRKEKSDVVSLIVQTEPKIIALIESPDYIVGNKATISVELVNKGLSNAQFLTIRLGNSDFYDTLSQSEVYIGSLNSDDTDNAKFDISLNYPLPGRDVEFSVFLDYYDALNNHKQEFQKASIKVYTEDEAKQLGLVSQSYTGLYIGIVVLVIILFIVYRKMRKRRKR